VVPNQSRSRRAAAYAIACVVAAALFAWLGLNVTRNGEPAWLLPLERALEGHSALIAWWLTWSCYIYVLAPVAIILLLLAWRFPAWRGRILFSIVMLVLCWQGADFFQHMFARPRRLDWIVKHEQAFSYPSSHAAIATGFYAVWGVMLLLSELPSVTRKVAGVLLVLFAIAICWARLALGAHYVTDIIGGALLAVALVCAGLAIVSAIFRGAVAGRVYEAAE
jgi:membrane-associated phospholipid phosphatase